LLTLSSAAAQAPSPPPPDKSGLTDRIEQYVDRIRVFLSTLFKERATGTREAGGIAQKQAPAPVVTASRPATRDVVDWDEFTGRIEAVETVEVRARVPGYLDK